MHANFEHVTRSDRTPSNPRTVIIDTAGRRSGSQCTIRHLSGPIHCVSLRAVKETQSGLRARSPESLVKACQAGDAEAWDLFLERFGRLIWSVALRLGTSHTEAEEVFQRSWVAIVEGIARLEKPESVHSWVAGIVRHQAYQYFDEQRRLRRFSPLSEHIESPPETTREAEVEQALLNLEVASVMHRALAELDRRCRRLLSMLFLEDPRPSYDEVSERTGLAIGSIGPIRARCLNRLRVVFGKLYQTRRDDDL